MSNVSRGKYVAKKTIEELKRRGFVLVLDAERKGGGPGRAGAKDFLGLIDFVAFRPDLPPLFVQCTTEKGFYARRKRFSDAPRKVQKLDACGTAAIWAWDQDRPGGVWYLVREVVVEWDPIIEAPNFLDIRSDMLTSNARLEGDDV